MSWRASYTSTMASPAVAFPAPKEMDYMVKAAGHGQLQQGKGQQSVCRERWSHGSTLLLHVWLGLLEEVPEGGPVIPGLLDNVLPPVLAGPEIPEVVGWRPRAALVVVSSSISSAFLLRSGQLDGI
ncbi:hypothetical protein Y1Q_0015453 [Alligator mississippiensis]|uniref:Uncharacterized protein n=1 Tax=Alligator mississippiensis TaxID=8496 RepID=A0A151NCX6_ALLMI|nr:hypothetical protein Y1Q_0015453 [Alligator mississippiensis]